MYNPRLTVWRTTPVLSDVQPLSYCLTHNPCLVLRTTPVLLSDVQPLSCPMYNPCLVRCTTPVLLSDAQPLSCPTYNPCLTVWCTPPVLSDVQPLSYCPVTAIVLLSDAHPCLTLLSWGLNPVLLSHYNHRLTVWCRVPVLVSDVQP